jgi:HEAT repeat protein
VAVGSQRSATPRQRVEAECARRGAAALVSGCVDLVAGADADPGLILALGGEHARRLLDDGPREDQRYWLRVWALRGLLWVCDARAVPAVRAGLGDPAWRVREMAAKVVARHRLGDLLSASAELRSDPVPRVRAAASRAVAALTRANA